MMSFDSTEIRIEKVLFDPPSTVVFWSDGSQTVVKCNVHDDFDPEQGLIMAIVKRFANNDPYFYKRIQNVLYESGCEIPVGGYKQIDKTEGIKNNIETARELLRDADKANEQIDTAIKCLHMVMCAIEQKNK